MIELLFGGLVALGLLITFWKSGWPLRMLLLSHPVKVDIVISAALVVLHGGSFSGGMVAALAALFCSIVLWLLRCCFGYYEHDRIGKFYVVGWFNIYHKLQPPQPEPSPVNHADFL